MPGLIATGPAALWALPVPVFPRPSGQFAVGTSVLQWTDSDRPETATPDPDDRRTVVVQLWYPARPSAAGAERARYAGRTAHEAHVVFGALADYLGVPGFLLDGAADARTRSVPEAAVADTGGRFPVVLFSPGLGGVRTQNPPGRRNWPAVGTSSWGSTIRTTPPTGDNAEDERRANAWTAVRAADLSFVLTRWAASTAVRSGDHSSAVSTPTGPR